VKVRILAASSLFALLWMAAPPAIAVCGFHYLTGRPCPLCGLTRALFALAKGHGGEALRLHPLAPLGFAMLFALFWDHPLRGRLWMAGIAAFAVYGLWRAIG